MKTLLTLLVLMCALNISAQHTQWETTDEISDCLAFPQNSSQIACLKIVLHEIDSSMNGYYGLLGGGYRYGTKSDRKNLEKSQELWRKMRDKLCLSYYNMRPPEEREAAKLNCLIELTTNRRNELSRFFNRFRM